MFQELSKNVKKYYNLQKKTVLNLELPKIRRLVSYTYCDLLRISKNTFFTEHVWVTASETNDCDFKVTFSAF